MAEQEKPKRPPAPSSPPAASDNLRPPAGQQGDPQANVQPDTVLKREGADPQQDVRPDWIPFTEVQTKEQSKE